MIINSGNLQGLFKGFNISFNKGLSNTTMHYGTVAMKIPSTNRETTYSWLGAMPGIREWIGDRVMHSLDLHQYSILNRLFEITVSVPRTQIEDDQYGVFGPIFEKMGGDTALHPDDLVFGLLKNGFTGTCFDGQFFFDTDHPIGRGDDIISYSNFNAGAGPAWFLLDCSQALKPVIYQERLPFELTQITEATDENVFFKDKFIYGARGRSNAGYGLWQLASASKDTLSADNYSAARTAMQSIKSDSGKPLGITPTHLVVPPSLERDARRLLKALHDQGGTNEWAGSAELIVTPFVI